MQVFIFKTTRPRAYIHSVQHNWGHFISQRVIYVILWKLCTLSMPKNNVLLKVSCRLLSSRPLQNLNYGLCVKTAPKQSFSWTHTVPFIKPHYRWSIGREYSFHYLYNRNNICAITVYHLIKWASSIVIIRWRKLTICSSQNSRVELRIWWTVICNTYLYCGPTIF